jgi:hypothetical protein
VIWELLIIMAFDYGEQRQEDPVKLEYAVMYTVSVAAGAAKT